MGEVYRARDTRLDRFVAIKTLPELFASDPERLARFEREAKTLAVLNHPNIAQIYGVEESNGTRALVMELVEGQTLADRIERGPIPIDEALPIAKQLAEALEAAHEQGIIHRDLKPANIKVRPDATVKVLDFGLAKLTEPKAIATSNAAVLSMSPTITSPALMSGVGVLLGTAAYMSPEQAKGKPADKRSDMWAFGCVLYEMLTGRRAFGGDDVSETLASVLAREPDWTVLPTTVPPPIRTLLRRCLEKDWRKRIGDIAVARFTIEEVGTLGSTASVSDVEVQPRIDAAVAMARAQLRRALRVRMTLLTAGAVLITGAAVGAVIWYATRPTPPRVVQLTVAMTPATALRISGAGRDLAITRDGSRIVYVGSNGTELFVRSLDALDPVSLYKADRQLRGPFVSPDGQWIGFVDNFNTLKKVAITGGPATTVTALDGPWGGAVWMPDDTIVFAVVTSGLRQTTSAGGAVKVLSRPDRARGEGGYGFPEVLPGGRAVIFTILSTTGRDAGGVDAAQIAVLDLQTQKQAVVLRGGIGARYVASGHLVYAAGGALRAIAFDPLTLTTRGTPIPVVTDVAINGGFYVDADIADDGTLAYVRGTGPPVAQRALVWLDRQGRETAIAAPPRAYVYPRISPDGSRIAVYGADQMLDLWAWDFMRLTLTRLTFASGLDSYPVWTPEGRRLFFASDREQPGRNLYAQAADGTGAAERLTTSPNQQNATAITPDGTRLLFTENAPPTNEDVMQVTVSGSHTVTPLVHTSAAERNGIVSPDGRWLAYEANDSGPFEIYVRPYPDTASGRWQVSTGGGTRPLWSRDGRELFYVSSANGMMRVGVDRAASWTATAPTMLLKDGSVVSAEQNVGRNYDVSPDGQRFLVVKPVNASNEAPQLVVVQHFDEVLKRLVPTK